MNLNEIALEETELHDSGVLDEGVAALVHTILFLRAPNLVKPQDHVCEWLAPLRYATCGPADVTDAVTAATATLRRSLTPCGPHLAKGAVSVAFFERREVKGFFGLTSNQERVYFERWRLPFVVDQRLLPSASSSSSSSSRVDAAVAAAERQQLCDAARDAVQRRLVAILEAANRSSDHVPPTMYEYELDASGGGADDWGRREQPSLVAKLINTGSVVT